MAPQTVSAAMCADPGNKAIWFILSFVLPPLAAGAELSITNALICAIGFLFMSRIHDDICTYNLSRSLVELLTNSFLAYLVLFCCRGPSGMPRTSTPTESSIDTNTDAKLKANSDNTAFLTDAATSPPIEASGHKIKQIDHEGFGHRVAHFRPAKLRRATRITPINVWLPGPEEEVHLVEPSKPVKPHVRLVQRHTKSHNEKKLKMMADLEHECKSLGGLPKLYAGIVTIERREQLLRRRIDELRAAKELEPESSEEIAAEVADRPPSPEQIQAETEVEDDMQLGKNVDGENTEIEGSSIEDDGKKSAAEETLEAPISQPQIPAPLEVEQDELPAEEQISENIANEIVEQMPEEPVLAEIVVDERSLALWHTWREISVLCEDEEDDELSDDELSENDGEPAPAERSQALKKLVLAMANLTIESPVSQPVIPDAALEPIEKAKKRVHFQDDPILEVIIKEVQAVPSPEEIPSPAPFESVRPLLEQSSVEYGDALGIEQHPTSDVVMEEAQQDDLAGILDGVTDLAAVPYPDGYVHVPSSDANMEAIRRQVDEMFDEPIDYESNEQDMRGIEAGEFTQFEEQADPALYEPQDTAMADEAWLINHWDPATNQYLTDIELQIAMPSMENAMDVYSAQFQANQEVQDWQVANNTAYVDMPAEQPQLVLDPALIDPQLYGYAPEYLMNDENNVVEPDHGMTEPGEVPSETEEPVFETDDDDVNRFQPVYETSNHFYPEYTPQQEPDSITRGGADSPYWMGTRNIPAALQSPTATHDNESGSPYPSYPSPTSAGYQTPTPSWTNGIGGLAPRVASTSFSQTIDPLLISNSPYTRYPAPAERYQPPVPAVSTFPPGFTGAMGYLHRHDQQDDEESDEDEEEMGADPRGGNTTSAGQTTAEKATQAAETEAGASSTTAEPQPPAPIAGSKRSGERDLEVSPKKRAQNGPEEGATEQGDSGEVAQPPPWDPLVIFGSGSMAAQACVSDFAFKGITNCEVGMEPLTEEDEREERLSKLSFEMWAGRQKREGR